MFSYRIMLPPTIKNNTENAPPLNLPIGQGLLFPLRVSVIKFNPFVITAIVCVISTVIYQIWCGELDKLQEV